MFFWAKRGASAGLPTLEDMISGLSALCIVDFTVLVHTCQDT